MTIDIGKNIQTLRRERSLTQEQIAEVFGVSVTAVSKWENATSHPDICLLPKIASFFDTSVDRLLGYDLHQVNASLDERLDEALRVFYTDWKKDEGLALISELALKYPGDVRIKTEYAMMKVMQFYNRPLTDERREKAMREAEAMLGSINTGVLNRQEHDDVLMVQWNMYMGQKRFTEAKSVVAKLRPGQRLNNFKNDELRLYMDSGDWEAAEKKFQDNLWDALLDITPQWAYMIYHVQQGVHEKVIAYAEMDLAILQAVTQGKPSYLDWRIGINQESIAHMYACLGDAEKALHHFEQAVEYGIRWRGLKDVPPQEAIPAFFDKIAAELAPDLQGQGNHPALNWALDSNERQAYDLIRDTPKFMELAAKIKEYNL